MKKLIAFLLCYVMVFSAAACVAESAYEPHVTYTGSGWASALRFALNIAVRRL